MGERFRFIFQRKERRRDRGACLYVVRIARAEPGVIELSELQAPAYPCRVRIVGLWGERRVPTFERFPIGFVVTGIIINYAAPAALVQKLGSDLGLAASAATFSGLDRTSPIDIRIVVGQDLVGQ